MTFDHAAVDAAIEGTRRSQGPSSAGCQHQRRAVILADACEYYRQQLAAVEKERNSARSLMIQVKVESTKRRDELAAATERAERMREACIKASAELRHCYGKGSLSQHDKGLVSRAIKILELSANHEGNADGK